MIDSEDGRSRSALLLGLLGHLAEGLEAAGADGAVLGAARGVEAAAGRDGIRGRQADDAGAVAGVGGGQDALALGVAERLCSGPLGERQQLAASRDLAEFGGPG